MSNAPADTNADHAPAEAARKAGLETLTVMRGLTLSLMDGITDEHLFTRTHPDGTHLAFIMGHLAAADHMWLSMGQGKEPSLAGWNEKFMGGAEVSDDPSFYPEPGVIRHEFEAQRESLRAWLAEMPADRLLAPVEGPLARFGSNTCVLMGTLGGHEGMHAGQITVIRRVLGLPRVM